MPLNFKGLSDNGTRMVFEDTPTAEPDDNLPLTVRIMPLRNVLGTIEIWAKTCQKIIGLEEVALPPKPSRKRGTTRDQHGAACHRYSLECAAVNARSEGLAERKGTEYIDRLMSGFALYAGLCAYANHTGSQIPDTPGIRYFKQELEAAKVDDDLEYGPTVPTATGHQPRLLIAGPA